MVLRVVSHVNKTKSQSKPTKSNRIREDLKTTHSQGSSIRLKIKINYNLKKRKKISKKFLHNLKTYTFNKFKQVITKT